MKRRTKGVDPKVPIQALVTLIVALAAYFGIDLSPEVAGAIGIVVGAVVAYFGPAAQTYMARARHPDEAGYTLVEVGIFLLLVAIAAAILFVIFEKT